MSIKVVKDCRLCSKEQTSLSTYSFLTFTFRVEETGCRNRLFQHTVSAYALLSAHFARLNDATQWTGSSKVTSHSLPAFTFHHMSVYHTALERGLVTSAVDLIVIASANTVSLCRFGSEGNLLLTNSPASSLCESKVSSFCASCLTQPAFMAP